MAGERALGEIADISQGRYLPPERMAVQASEATPIPIRGARGGIGFTDTPSDTTAVPLVTRRGNGCGLVQWTGGCANIFNNAMAVVPLTSEPFDARCLYYSLLSTDFGDVTTGSAQPQITIGHLSRNPVVWSDDAHERAAIAHILGTLDDKIELNRRMSETLEAMACALFKSWFVDFDPVRQKSQRRDANSKRQDAKAQRREGERHVAPASSRPGGFAFPQHILDLFPARLVDSELGEIPEGWEVVRIGDVLGELVSGGRPKGGAAEEGVPSIGAENVIGLGKHDFSKEKYVPRQFFKGLLRKGSAVRPRDVLLYNRGDRVGHPGHRGRHRADAGGGDGTDADS